MTRAQLLRNLNEAKITNLMKYQYKVLADIKHQGARSLYIVVFHITGIPVYVLKYRLDIDFLADHDALGFYPMKADDLKAFEFAASSK